MCRWRRSPRQQWRFSPDRKSKRLTSVNTTTSMVSTPTTIYTLSLHDALPIFFGRRKLRWAQRYHFLSGWLPWISDGLGLIVTIFALVWTLLMILAPRHFDVPMAALSAAAVALFAAKTAKTLLLYPQKVGSGVKGAIFASAAGLALTHTVAKAMWSGLFTSRKPFLRTP